MIFNMGAGGASTAEAVQYDNSNSGLEATNVQGAVDEVGNRLQNEDNETFNYGVKDGVRGFFTDSSRADDSFIPFSSIALIGTYSQSSGSAVSSFTFDLTSYEKYSELRLNENMLVCIKNYGHGSNAGSNEAFAIEYNNATGELTVKHSGMYKLTIAVYAKSTSDKVNCGIIEAISDSAISVDLGFKPTKLSLIMYASDDTWMSLNYNADADSDYYYTGYRASTSKIYRYNINTNNVTPILKLTDSGFVFTANATGTYHYVASA